MGYFTWTLANRKPKKTKYGDYTASSILCYGSYGAIVCPDNTIIKEPYYDGYGMFDKYDVYDLVADWNKSELLNIMQIPDIANDPFFTDNLKAIAKAFATDDKAALYKALASEPSYMKQEWKRNIGIAIACQHNHLIPYPIKIVNTKSKHKKYEDLPPSIATQ